MHGEEDTLHGDSGYIGVQKHPEAITRNKAKLLIFGKCCVIIVLGR